MTMAAASACGPRLLCASAGSRAARRRRCQRPGQRWFEDAKFGLFIHWGVYSLLGKGEWVMEQRQAPDREYAKLPPRFNPTEFDAEAWVKLAKDGRREIHHDHEQAPRRLLHVRQQADRLRHRRRHALRHGPAQGAGRRLPSSRGSSSSSIIRCSTGTTPTTSRGARPARPPAARTRATGSGTSPITRARSASSAPITARSAASGSTAGGTGPTPIGTSPARTG